MYWCDPSSRKRSSEYVQVYVKWSYNASILIKNDCNDILPEDTAVAEQTFSAQQYPGQACLIQIIWDLFRPEFSGSAAIYRMLFTDIVLRLPDFLLQHSFIAFLNNTSQVTCPHRMSNPLYLNITLLVESQTSLYFQDSSCQSNCPF